MLRQGGVHGGVLTREEYFHGSNLCSTLRMIKQMSGLVVAGEVQRIVKEQDFRCFCWNPAFRDAVEKTSFLASPRGTVGAVKPERDGPSLRLHKVAVLSEVLRTLVQ